MGAPQEVLKLVERFDSNHESYMSGEYKEAQIRIEFIDPFFEQLGWDMGNKHGYAEAYKDVIHEDSIKIGSATEAPDYCFRIGGTRKFFLEAKKPSVFIKEALHPAYQLRRYAWSSKLPLSILTDFEEFAIYDCRFKPNKNDSPALGRIKYFTYRDYPEKWDEIYSVFSREAILKGSFDKYAETAKGKKGTASVDASFLEEIENWRANLAKNIAVRNSQLSTRELNFAVQKTIDRIIFLRICEDRGIEHYGKLGALQNGVNVYDRLVQHFRIADGKYNSGLFHFSDEKNRPEEPDSLTLNLKIDDKILKEIVGTLYYPECPFEFSVLPADILGQVYEQFLGKVIRLTDGHQAKVEEKPEVRKAGGVYYTPSYIVDYIVQNTVGKLLEDRKVESKLSLRVLDPACGSGSFLIVAYQRLLDWYLKKYTEVSQEKWGKGKNTRIRRGSSGDWKLTINERKRILLDHIYGVDIDPQAVEVTKLSLLLKVLEGENEETMKGQLLLLHERALPDLGQNIKCGNSLVGSDFNKDTQDDLFNEEKMYRVNAFDWEKEFPDVFNRKETKTQSNSGFDAVIGNPPYIRIQTLQESSPEQVEYLKDHYVSASSGNYDIYVTFVEKGLSVLNEKGKLGFILPHKFFNSKYGEPLRKIISEGKHLKKIVHFGDQQVFENATTYTCLLFLSKQEEKEFLFQKVNNLRNWISDGQAEEGQIKANSISALEWNFSLGGASELYERLMSNPLKLGDVADIFVGLQTSADKIYVIPIDSEIEKKLTKPFLLTGDLKPYFTPSPSARLIFPYDVKDGKAKPMNEETLRQKYPIGWNYLYSKREQLKSRNKGVIDMQNWYAYVYPKNLIKFEEEKLIVQVTAQRPTVLLDESGLYMTGGGSGPFYGIRPKVPEIPIKYLLGILNSSFFNWIVHKQSTNLRGGYIKFSKQYIETFPININRNNEMLPLVERLLVLNKNLQEASVPQIKTTIQRQIEATSKEIDRKVYALYGLTEEEIKIVEGN